MAAFNFFDIFGVKFAFRFLKKLKHKRVLRGVASFRPAAMLIIKVNPSNHLVASGIYDMELSTDLMSDGQVTGDKVFLEK